MSLEDIERRFYSAPIPENPNPEKKDPDTETHTAPTPAPAPSGSAERWKEEKSSVGSKIGKILLIGGIIAALALGGFAGFSVFKKIAGNNSVSPITVDVYAPSQTYRGAPFEARINVSADGEETMENGEITISFTPGLLIEGGGSEVKESIAKIEPGVPYEKKIQIFSVGDVGSVEKIKAIVTFKNGVREEMEREIFIKESGIRLSVSRTQIPSENSKFEIKIAYENASQATFKNAKIQIAYPAQFSFVSASPNPSDGNGSWSLSDVRPRGSGVITVQGIISQSSTASIRIPAVFSADAGGETFSLIEEAAVLSSTPAPFIVSFKKAGSQSYVAELKNPPEYSINIKNNSGIALADVVATVKLEGALFDFSKLTTKGTFNSVENSIQWTASQVPKFRIFATGDASDISFLAPLVGAFPIKTSQDKNFVLKGTLEITSPTVPQGGTAEKTYISIPFETKVMGDAKIEAQAWRKDPQAILNTGTLPLRPNQPVQYTIRWKIKNYATDLRDVVVSASLPSGVSFTDVEKTSAGMPALTINKRTQTVEWKIPLIEAGAGVLGQGPEAVFQIELLPNVSQVGRVPELLNETKFSATDAFTGVAINRSYGKITTLIQNDPTFKKGDEVVAK